jgi:hypothetical protein
MVSNLMSWSEEIEFILRASLFLVPRVRQKLPGGGGTNLSAHNSD